MSKEKSLESHNLIRSLLTNLRPVLEAAGKELVQLAEKTGEVRKKSGTRLPEPYFYHHEVLYYANSLLKAISRMKDIQTYLTRFPQPRTYERHGITQDKWIEYHYSNYVVTVVSLYDIALILTNVVFRLGIPPRQCRDGIIKENRWVKMTQVKPALDRLNQHIKSYREPRHLHVHRGQVPELEQLDMLKLFSFVQLHSDPIVDPKTIDFLYSHEIRAIRSSLKAECKGLEQAIWDLFDALLPIYEARTRSLHRADAIPPNGT